MSNVIAYSVIRKVVVGVPFTWGGPATPGL